MSYIPQAYLSNYIHTYINVFSSDDKKYGGLFEGFDNQNNIYLNECTAKEACEDDVGESPKTITYLGMYLLPISEISAIYSRDLPSPEYINAILPKNEALKERNFCISEFCESLDTGVSPTGGYVGPYRGVNRHVQPQPFCNCSYPPQSFGPQTTIPVPMAMRSYLYNHCTPKNNKS